MKDNTGLCTRFMAIVFGISNLLCHKSEDKFTLHELILNLDELGISKSYSHEVIESFSDMSTIFI